jgi:hypothetical protein
MVAALFILSSFGLYINEGNANYRLNDPAPQYSWSCVPNPYRRSIALGMYPIKNNEIFFTFTKPNYGYFDSVNVAVKLVGPVETLAFVFEVPLKYGQLTYKDNDRVFAILRNPVVDSKIVPVIYGWNSNVIPWFEGPITGTITFTPEPATIMLLAGAFLCTKLKR